VIVFSFSCCCFAELLIFALNKQYCFTKNSFQMKKAQINGVFICTILTPSAPTLPLKQVAVTPQVTSQAHAAINLSVQQNGGIVQKLNTELANNGGIIPASWLPWLNAIKLVLDAVMIFAGPELLAICNVILAAINAAEGVSNS
jgi:hypothetical protein